MVKRHLTLTLLGTALLSPMGFSAQAAEPITPPPGGTDLVTFADPARFQFSAQQAATEGGWNTIKEMPFARAFRVSVATRPRVRQQVHWEVPLVRSAAKDSTLLLSFWIRRPQSGGEPGPTTIAVRAGSQPPYYKLKLSAYRDWQQHVRAFKAPSDIDAANAFISIDVGNSGPAIEIADLRCIDYGGEIDIADLPRSAVTYAGREPNAAWRQEALARIETIRKSDLTVQVVDASGKPIPNANVNVQMQRHAFGFGNVVDAQLLGLPEAAFPYTRERGGTAITSSWADAQKYRDVVKEHFNTVTFESELRPHKWQEMTSDTPLGRQLYTNFAQRAVPWLRSHDIAIRGHYIAWGAIDFNESEREFVGRPQAHRQWLWNHMADVLPQTADYVSEWDTINHIIGWGKHTYEIEYGGYDIYAQLLQEARRLAPDARHSINEGKVLPNGYKREPYKRVIRFLNDHGQAPDTVGFMAHFELTSLTPPVELLSVYDDFGKIAPRLQLSEFDVETGDDEQLQADYYRDVLIATFSHPNFVSIVQWGFWENAHWKPAAALWRRDWSLKPSGQVFVDLVKRQWSTDETATTDAEGHCQVRGFLGDYHINVDHQGRKAATQAVLKPGGTHVQIEITQDQ